MKQLLRLLMLLAVIISPLGMANAVPTAAQHSAASMPVQHCPEQGKAGFAHCAMACSAALPASATRQVEPPPITCSAPPIEVAHQLHGLHAETATPPPKHS
ncbi:MAG TPA: hypothetical protein VF757_05740 [Sphingomicrobium sp.]